MGSSLNKVRNRVGYINRVAYKEFIKQYPESGISYEEYILILKESTRSIRDFILNNELGFKLPFNLGYIAVDKYKPGKSTVPVDWVNSRRLKRLIPLTNFHSLGYMFKIKLYKNPKIKPLYAFDMQAHRIIKRMLAANIKQEKGNYISIDRSYFSRRFNIDKYLSKDKKSNNG